MLSFLVHDSDAGQAEQILRHAHLVGPDNMPVAGELAIRDGEIVCLKNGADSTGLALQVGLSPAGFLPRDAAQPDAGVLTLQTCLLPERRSPYLLSLELARHRIMLFYNKLEDWNLVDLPADHPAIARFEQARALFMQALATRRPGASTQTFTYEPATDRLARRALEIAVDAGERLALEQARRNFVPRVTGAIYDDALARARAAGRPPQRAGAPIPVPSGVGVIAQGPPLIGCSISPGSFTDAAQNVAARAFDFIAMPMRWIEMEPVEGRYAFKSTDQWIEWAVRKARLQVCAGPLIDFRPLRVPEWLYIWENDYATLRDYVIEHVKNLVTRYRRTISRWTVVSGIHVNDNFRFSFDQMMDLTRAAIARVRQLNPTARVIIEVDQPWGEYYTANRRSLPPTLYADTIAQQIGAMVDGIGIRVQMGSTHPGQSSRDLMAFSALLDRYGATEKPIAVTAIGAPSQALPASNAPELASLHPGCWRGPWTERTQADWASAAVAIAAAKPFVTSVCWQDLYDVPHPIEMHRGGLISVSGETKPAADRLADITAAVREGRLPAALDPDLLLGPIAPPTP